MIDGYKHKGLRKKLIHQLRLKGITDESLLAAMESLPRHFFLDKAFEEVAYEDKAFPIGSEQTISQPYTVAYQTSLLEIKKRDKVLEVGTGSGYQACILKILGARVFTIERQEALYHKVTARFKEMGFTQIRCFLRDGYKGLPEFAPFDKILVTAGAEHIPTALLDQLKEGGKLVIPVGPADTKEMVRITKMGPQKFEREVFDLFRFVPLLKGLKKKKSP